MMESVFSWKQNTHNDGQSDDMNAELPSDSFVLPAAFVSKIGRGSSGAGHDYIESIFPSAKGEYEEASYGPVMLARDEHVLMPDQVAHIGGGDIVNGHKLLASWVERILGEPVGSTVDG